MPPELSEISNDTLTTRTSGVEAEFAVDDLQWGDHDQLTWFVPRLQLTIRAGAISAKLREFWTLTLHLMRGSLYLTEDAFGNRLTSLFPRRALCGTSFPDC